MCSFEPRARLGIGALGLLSLAAGCLPPPLSPLRTLEQLRAQSDLRPQATAAPESLALSEDEAVALALERNVALKPFEREQEVARGQILAATQIDNPTLQLQRIDFNLPIQQGWQFGLRWSPPRPWVLLGRREQAEAELAAAQAELAERRLSLGAEVRAEHARLSSLGEEVKLAEAVRREREGIAEAVGARVAGGAGTRNDLLAAQGALAQATAEEGALKEQRAAVVSRFRGLLNLTPGSPVAVRSSPQPLVEPGERLALERRAVEHRPRLKVLEAKYQKQAQEVSLARLERLPWLRLTALPRVSFQPVIDRTELTVGVELFFPVWNWNLGKIATEEARLLRDGDQYVAEMAQLRKDVAMALEQVASRRALLALYEADLLPALEARVAGVKQAVQGAQADRTALFIAQDALLNAQRTTVRARRDLRLSQIELDRALGGGTAGATP